MDPVSQILAQSNAGSAQGQGFGDFAVQGRQLANQERGLSLSERRLELEREQEERMSMLAPLQREAMRNQNIATGLQIEAARRDEQNLLQSKEAELAVSGLMSELTRNGTWGTPESWQAWSDITRRSPVAAVSKSGEYFLQQQRLAMANQELAQRFGGPAQVKVPTAEGGEAIYGSTVDPEIAKRRIEIAEMNAITARLNAEINKKRAENNIEKFTEELPQMERDSFRAELKALDNRMDLMTDPAKYEQELERVKSKYSTKLPARPSPQSAPSGNTVQPKANFKVRIDASGRVKLDEIPK